MTSTRRSSFSDAARAALAALLLGGAPAGPSGADTPAPAAQETAGTAPAAPSAPENPELRRRYAELLKKKFLLARERQLKELHLQLAEEGHPYIVLDLEDRALHIMMRTVRLKSIPLVWAEIEGEQPEFSAQAPPPDWVEKSFTLAGKSGPLRDLEKIVPRNIEDPPTNVDPRSVTPDQIGLDVEPEYPSRYTLLFREGLAVAVDAGVLGQMDQTWVTRGIERLANLFAPPARPSLPDASPIEVWIHVGMTPANASALYPSLFPEMRAFVRLPGDPRL